MIFVLELFLKVLMPIEELVSCGTYNILDVSPLRSLLIIVNDSLLLVYIEFF